MTVILAAGFWLGILGSAIVLCRSSRRADLDAARAFGYRPPGAGERAGGAGGLERLVERAHDPRGDGLARSEHYRAEDLKPPPLEVAEYERRGRARRERRDRHGVWLDVAFALAVGAAIAAAFLLAGALD